MDGLHALVLWDIVIEVLRTTKDNIQPGQTRSGKLGQIQPNHTAQGNLSMFFPTRFFEIPKPVDFTCLICCNQTHFAFTVGHELVVPSFESVLWTLECFRHAIVVSV